MNSLGIYFGPQVISIVQTQGKKVLNNVQVPHSIFSAGEGLEEKVPDELKIVAIFKDELRKHRIEAKEAVVSLSGQDLIVRNFDMLTMPKEELHSAVNFEAKKYIPFKVEDLVSDFQVTLDRTNRRNLVLFMGIKKGMLDKYLSILNQLNIKAKSIEYSAFSILRLIKLSGINQKGIIGLVSVDFKEKDEVNFVVLENGFPVFSRDITLTGGPEEFAMPESPDSSAILDKLKTEVRVSLDFYHRKFPHKKIARAFFICNPESSPNLTAFMKDMGLTIQFIDISKYIGKQVGFSTSFVKGYSSSLYKIINTNVKINLLAPKVKVRGAKKEIIPEEGLLSLLKGVKAKPNILVSGLIICLAAFAFGYYQRTQAQKEINKILSMRPKVLTADPASSYEELTRIDSEYKAKIDTLDKFIRQQMYFTEQLDAIPRAIPDNIWLTDLSSERRDQNIDFTLKGIAYVGDSSKELELINTFLSKLKENPAFVKYFKEIELSSVDNSQIGQIAVTNFTIQCRTSKRRQ